MGVPTLVGESSSSCCSYTFSVDCDRLKEEPSIGRLNWGWKQSKLISNDFSTTKDTNGNSIESVLLVFFCPPPPPPQIVRKRTPFNTNSTDNWWLELDEPILGEHMHPLDGPRLIQIIPIICLELKRTKGRGARGEGRDSLHNIPKHSWLVPSAVDSAWLSSGFTPAWTSVEYLIITKNVNTDGVTDLRYSHIKIRPEEVWFRGPRAKVPQGLWKAILVC